MVLDVLSMIINIIWTVYGNLSYVDDLKKQYKERKRGNDGVNRAA